MYYALSAVRSRVFSDVVLDYNSGFFMLIRGRMTGLSIGRRMVSPPLGEGLEIDIVRRLRAKGHHKSAGKGRARGGRQSALGGLNGWMDGKTDCRQGTECKNEIRLERREEASLCSSAEEFIHQSSPLGENK